LGFIKNKAIAYKSVLKIGKKFLSYHDNSFEYKVGKIAKAQKPDISERSCSSGLHASGLNYWTLNESIDSMAFIAVEILRSDIITIQDGKIRCKKLKVLGEVTMHDKVKKTN
jgi:hypothetical protein